MLNPTTVVQQTSPSRGAAYGVKANHRMENGSQPALKSPNATPPGPDVSGVGIFFQVPEHDQGTAYVQHIVPRSSADRCGVIQLGDELLAAGEVGQKPTNIENRGLLVLREKILGKQGSFVVLHFRRKHSGEIYDIELMRGSPEYIEMMNVSTGLKEKQQNDMMRIHELENQVSNLQQQVQAYAAQIQVNEDPRIGPLEDELRARMDDLRRFEDMLLRAKDRTSEAIRARDDVVEELEMMKRAQILEDKTSQIVVEDSDQFRSMQKDLENALRDNKVMQEERDEVKRERDQLKQQLRQFKVRRRVGPRQPEALSTSFSTASLSPRKAFLLSSAIPQSPLKMTALIFVTELIFVMFRVRLRLRRNCFRPKWRSCNSLHQLAMSSACSERFLMHDVIMQR